ncbi:MAG: class I SAM-dependent methyltransferase [Paludibacteraceae bacterium]|nr:class I SAM-dependent methyltransferase [Paludibacteraceae bacterium]
MNTPQPETAAHPKKMQLRQTVFRAISYLRHQLSAWNTGGEGIHSPYLFYWVRHCLYDQNGYYAFREIEKQRQAMLQSSETVTVTDYGTGKMRSSTRRVKDIAATSLESPKNAQTLFRLVRFLSDKELHSGREDNTLNIIELGTNLGITTAYLAAPSSKNKVCTLEGSKALTEIARQNWRKLKANNITAIEGNIDNTLAATLKQLRQIDMAFIDANHTKEATMRYWHQIMPYIRQKSVVVIDDIHWSKEMEQAWKQIQNDRRVACTMDLYDMGMVFFDPAYLHRNYRLRI